MYSLLNFDNILYVEPDVVAVAAVRIDVLKALLSLWFTDYLTEHKKEILPTQHWLVVSLQLTLHCTTPYREYVALAIFPLHLKYHSLEVLKKQMYYIEYKVKSVCHRLNITTLHRLHRAEREDFVYNVEFEIEYFTWYFYCISSKLFWR